VHRAHLNRVRGRGWGRRTSRISSCTSLILTPPQDVKVPVRSDRRNCTEEGRSWLAGHSWVIGWRAGIRWSYLDVLIEHTGLCLLTDAVCNSAQMTSPAAKKLPTLQSAVCTRENAIRFYGKLQNVFNLHPVTEVSLIATNFRKFDTSRREMYKLRTALCCNTPVTPRCRNSRNPNESLDICGYPF